MRQYSSPILNLLLPLLSAIIPISLYGIVPIEAPDHYIVAFDPYVGIYNMYYNNPEILNKVQKDLEDHGYRSDEDYISVVGYALEMGYPDMGRFARSYQTKDGGELKWSVIGKKSLRDFFPSWPAGQPDLKNGPAASAQILAKPYTVNSVIQSIGNSDRKLADHTYLVMVTDDMSNGGNDDFKKEWDNIATAGVANVARFRSIKASVFEQMRKFNNRLKFVSPDKNAESPISPNGVYRIMWYELLPAVSPSIYSATTIPTPLPLRRIRGGFALDIDAEPVSPEYSIHSFTVLNSRGDTLISEPQAIGHFEIPSSALSAGDTINLRVNIAYNDSLYNGTLMSPENFRYSSGLSHKQVVKIVDDGKILGIFPLVDSIWWWFPQDARMAVILWDIIIALIVIILVLWFGYVWLKKAATYVPDDKTIKISHL